MTSDKKDNSEETSGEKKTPASPRRPSRIIELEAEEIENKPDQKSADKGDAAAKNKEADKSDTSSKPDDKRPKRPPQRTKPSDVKSFVTHLAAGLIGGLVGVIGAGVGLDKLSLMGNSGQGEKPGQIAQLEDRLSALDVTLASQSKSLEALAKLDALDKFDTRLGTLEKKPDAALVVPKDITDRLAKLEGTLKTLISAAGEEGASGLEQSAALTAKIDAVSSDFEKRSGNLNSDIVELKKMLAEGDGSQTSDNGPAVGALGSRLDALEKQISDLATRPASSGQVSRRADMGSKGAALALAFESLRRATESGDAYSSQLDALVKLAPEGLDLTELKKHAGSGTETERSLLQSLPVKLREARAVVAKPAEDTFLNRAMSKAQSVVRVRRIGPVEGNSSEAILARMEARMKAADLAGALREAKSLKGPALEPLTPWLDAARARLAIASGLNQLEKRLLASLKPANGTQR